MINTTMEHKGFKAQVMEADRLIGDYVHELPPGNALPVYPVDMLLKPPENWMKGQGVFVIPVRPNKGLWFNWTQNSDNNTAVIPTVKGCNPITGMPTSGFHMERYENKCPKHGCDFLHGLFCPECNYKWPVQNYVGPKNILWFDGFFKDGTVRQFFFSEDELRDVASTLIGKNNTVPAFGFAFYAPKERRPETTIYHNTAFKYYDGNLLGVTGFYGQTGIQGASINQVYYSNNSSETSFSTLGIKSLCCDSAPNEVKTSGGSILGGGTSDVKFGACLNDADTSPVPCSSGPVEISEKKYRSLSCETSGRRAELRCASVHMDERLSERSIPIPVKDVSIGAGARIKQNLNRDPYELSSWKETPDSVMTIYFVFQEKFEELKSKGLRDLNGNKEGFLNSCVVG